MFKKLFITTLIFVPSLVLALPAPNHEMWFGYYHVDSQYGDFKDEVKDFTNVQVILQESFIRSDLNEVDKLKQAFEESIALGHKVIYGISTPVLMWDRGLEPVKPYWDDIEFIYLADEPNWDKAQTERVITDFKTKLGQHNLSDKLIAINYTPEQIKNLDGYKADNLDIIGFEAYINPNLQDDSQLVQKLKTQTQEIQNLVGNKKHFIVIQGYDRNGSWKNINSLKSIQTVAYDLAYQNENTIGLLAFTWARKGGTREYPILQNEHKTIASAILGIEIPVEPEPETPEPRDIKYKDLGSGTFPDVIFHSNKIWVAVQEGSKLKLHSFNYDLTGQRTIDIPYDGGQAFPRLTVHDGILWLAFRNGDTSSGQRESIKLWRQDSGRIEDLAGGYGNDPVALGNGYIAWQRSNSSNQKEIAIRPIEGGETTIIGPAFSTGISRITETGDVVSINSDLNAVDWGLRAWLTAEPLAVATDITPHDDNGIAARFNNDPNTEFNLWTDQRAHTPHAATDNNGMYAVVTWNPTARIAVFNGPGSDTNETEVINATRGWEGTLAFNSKDNNWLVTSQAVIESGEGYSVRGRIISNNGDPITDEFEISGDRPWSMSPRAAYIPDINKFFVAWVQSVTETTTQIWGIFINPNGTLDGEAIEIFRDGSVHYPEPISPPYDPIRKKIILNFSTGNYPNNFSRVIEIGTDKKVSSVIKISDPVSAPTHIAINPEDKEYCIAYRWFDEGQNRGGVRIRSLNPETGVVSSPSDVAISPGGLGIAFNSVDKEYLVIYNREGPDVYGKILQGCSMANATEEFSIQSGAGRSSIAYNPKSNTYGIISQDQNTLRNLYTILEASGNILSEDYVFTNGGHGNYAPSIAPNINNGTFAVTSSMDYGTTRMMANVGSTQNRSDPRRPLPTITNPPIPTEGLTDFGGLIALIFAWSLRLLGLSIFLVIAYSGLKIFMANGDLSAIKTSRERIKDALIGGLILLAAYLILYTINPDLVRGNISLPGVGVTRE